MVTLLLEMAVIPLKTIVIDAEVYFALFAREEDFMTTTFVQTLLAAATLLCLGWPVKVAFRVQVARDMPLTCATEASDQLFGQRHPEVQLPPAFRASSSGTELVVGRLLHAMQRIADTHVEQKPEQVLPPLASFSASGVLHSVLVRLVDSVHEFLIVLHNLWRTDLESDPIPEPPLDDCVLSRGTVGGQKADDLLVFPSDSNQVPLLQDLVVTVLTNNVFRRQWCRQSTPVDAHRSAGTNILREEVQEQLGAGEKVVHVNMKVPTNQLPRQVCNYSCPQSKFWSTVSDSDHCTGVHLELMNVAVDGARA